MKKLGITLTEAGISGAPMIPMMVFVTTFIRNNGKLDYILPFVIFYSFLKIGAFTVSVFGEVNNPFRLAQFASLTVILGSVLILSRSACGNSVIYYREESTFVKD